MIRVQMAPEPAGFEEKVRSRGLQYLSEIEQNNEKPNWKNKNYWKHCMKDLRHAYHSICAYTGIEINPSGGVVDHFKPKSLYRELAYEWSNYRLAISHINARKRDYEDVLDPFEIENGWFHLNLVTGSVYPNPELNQSLKKKIAITIQRLNLNDYEYTKNRVDNINCYISENISEPYLKIHAPFIFFEMQRQHQLS